MWMIWAMLGVGLPVLAVGLYGWWHNKKVDEYNEWEKQQDALKEGK
jgi:hypothetical protein